MGGDHDGYFVRPSRLSRAAGRVAECGRDFTSLSGEQQSNPLPANAFGMLPESSLVSTALANSTSHMAADLNSAAEQASNTSHGLSQCCHAYRHADDSIAERYHRLHDHCHPLRPYFSRRSGSGR